MFQTSKNKMLAGIALIVMVWIPCVWSYCSDPPLGGFDTCTSQSEVIGVYDLFDNSLSKSFVYTESLDQTHGNRHSNKTKCLMDNVELEICPCQGSSCKCKCEISVVYESNKTRVSYPHSSATTLMYSAPPVLRSFMALATVPSYTWSCMSTYKDSVVSTICTVDTNVTILLTKSGLDTMYVCTHGMCSYQLPQIWRATTGYMTCVYTYSNEAQVEQVWVPGEKFCVIKDSYTVEDMWYAAACLPPRVRYTWMIPLVIVGCLFIYFFGAIIIGILCCPYRSCVWGRNTGKYYYRKWKMNRIRKAAREEEDEELRQAEREARIAKAQKKAGTSKLLTSSLVILGLVAKCLGQDCSSGGVTTGSFTECSVSGSIETCKLTGSLSFEIPFVHTKGCYTLSDGSRSFQINVTYVEVMEIINLQSMYYTASRTLISETVFRCYKAGACTTSGCPNVDPQDVTGRGELSDEVVQSWPGKTLCFAGPGGWGNGCFLTNDGCIFSRFAIVPNGKAWLVSRPLTLSRQIWVQVSANNGTANTVFDYTAAGQTLSKGPFSLTTTTSMTGTAPTYLASYYILQDTGSTSSSTPSNTVSLFGTMDGVVGIGSNKWGSIGEIQSLTRSSLITPSINAFSIPFENPTTTTSGKTVTYTLPISGIERYASSMKAFPLTISNNLWYVYGTTIAHNSTPGIILKGTLNFPNGYLVTRTVDVVCPLAGFINITGCYNCVPGYTVTTWGLSQCSAGTTVLTDTLGSLTTSSLSLSRENMTFILNGRSSVANFDTYITFSGSPKAVVHVVGKLAEYIPDGPDNNSTNTTGNHDHTAGTAWWFDMPTWEKALTTTGMALALVCLVGVSCLIAYSVYKFTTKKKTV